MHKHIIIFLIGIFFFFSLSAQSISVTIINYNPSLYENREIFLCFKQGDQPGKLAHFFKLKTPAYLYKIEQSIHLDMLKATVFYVFLKDEPNVSLPRDIDADNLDSITVVLNKPSQRLLRNAEKLPVIEITTETQTLEPIHNESLSRSILRRTVS